MMMRSGMQRLSPCVSGSSLPGGERDESAGKTLIALVFIGLGGRDQLQPE